MPSEQFFLILDSLLPRNRPPWDVWNFDARVHILIFVHRVDGIAPGIYMLVRNQAGLEKMRTAMRNEFSWSKVEGASEHLPLYQLQATECARTARILSCRQAIASDGCFALGMLAEYAEVVEAEPWRYRQLHWEAGLIGQVLYLQAEAAGYRGTGIGCFFDDAVHELLGLADRQFQSLYHFTIGKPLVDERIISLPAYPGRSQTEEKGT